MALETGQIVDGKYRIVRQLGVGGMGAVYEGENVRIHRKVAIKVLHAAVATKADIVQRFEREAQAAGRIGSSHIVEVIDLGNLPEGDRFMVMEYLDGESLGDRLKRLKRIAPADLGAIAVQVLDGLAAAHAAGIIHRDLKPDNIYLLKPKSPNLAEFVKILDFGVSKFSSLDSDMSMTSTGAVMGTPYYLSPEQARGGKVDARSDVYAMGVVLYQCLAGVVPFHADSFNELLFKIALETARPLGAVIPGIDPVVVGIVDRAMAREPLARFPTAAEMRDAMAAWLASGAGGALPPRGPAHTGPFNPALGQSGGGFAQSGGPFAQSGGGGGGFAQSGGGHGGAFAQSGGGHGGAFAQSGGGHGALAQSGSGHGAFAQSGQPMGQSGGGFAQGGQPMGQSGGPLGQSGAPFGQSGGPLGQSGGPMGQSGGGAFAQHGIPLGQSGSPLGQSGGPMGQSGGPMGQSSVALAVTSPQQGKGSKVAALLLGTLLLGGGIGGGVWYVMNRPTGAPTTPAASPAPAPTASPSATPDPPPSASAEAPPPASAAPPDTLSTNEPVASAAPTASAAPSAVAVATPRPPAGGAKPPAAGARPPAGGTKPPGGGAKPPSTGGRAITGAL